MEPVVYSDVLPALVDPVYPVEWHDEDGNIVTNGAIMGDSPGIAAFRGYMSAIKVLGPCALFL
jgi:hypothetical protein